MKGMNIHNISKYLPGACAMLCAGILGGALLVLPPTVCNAQRTGQQIIQDQAETNEQLIRSALGLPQETTLDQYEEDSETSTSRGGAQVPETPQAPGTGDAVRTSVRNNLRSRCSQRCGLVLQRKLRTCSLDPSPQECSNRAQSNFQLCSVQCN